MNCTPIHDEIECENVPEFSIENDMDCHINNEYMIFSNVEGLRYFYLSC